MNNKLINRVVAALLFLSSSTVVQAQPFTSFDARSMGMGGSSVASSKLANAAYSNPALISKPVGHDNVQLLLPVIGINIDDSQGLQDDIDTLNQAYDAFDIPTAVTALDRSLGKPLAVQAYAGGAVGFSVDDYAMVLIYNKQYQVDFRTQSIGILVEATLEGRGLEYTDVGVAVPLYSGDNFKFGITPKIVSVKSYEYSQLLIDVVAGTAIVRRDSGRKIHGSHFNIDVGSAYDFNNGFVIGMIARNLNSTEYTTVLGNKIKLEPAVRAGFAYNGSLFSIAADMDLTENKAIAYAENTKLVTVGVELNFFDWVAIRVGHQQNTVSKYNQAMNSIGLGFTPFGVGLDLAVIGNQHAIGGSVQLSFSF